MFLLLVLSNCKKYDPIIERDTLNSKVSVAAAANLRDVLQDIRYAYAIENPHNKVDITFGSSGLLTQQIINGAPFDLFLSANTDFAEEIKKLGKNDGNPKIYAFGKVAMWSTRQDVSKGLSLILNSDVKKIAIANPELAPYGKSTMEALKKAGLYSAVEKKIVWAENINQAAQFASTGNADVAFIALSNAKSKEMTARGNVYELSGEECSPIAQSGIIIKSKNKEGAKEFFDFVTSAKAAEIWTRHGYQTKITR